MQRHSVTAVPGDIESSSSGLRPRVNYKSIYTGRPLSGSGKQKRPSCPTLRTSVSGYSSCDETAALDESAATLMTHSINGSSSSSYQGNISSSRRSSMTWPEDDPVMDHHHHHHPSSTLSTISSEQSDSKLPTPSTMEIAPNVRVPVRSSKESYDAVQAGDYTVATCFVCASALVCTTRAAYVLCPDCQVVSPISYGDAAAAASSDTKKDDPYGVATGLKREWVHDMILPATGVAGPSSSSPPPGVAR